MSTTSTATQIVTTLSTLASTREAAREVCQSLRSKLTGEIDLLLVFASAHHRDEMAVLAEMLQAELSPGCMLGTSGESIVCDAREIEGQPALSVWAARLPGVSLTTMHLQVTESDGGHSIGGWPEELADKDLAGNSLLLLAEPYSFPADQLLVQLYQAQRGLRVFGGMSSGGWGPGQNALILNGREVAQGAVGVIVSGAIEIRPVVSQGCKPIGRPYVVTKAQQNVIFELGGRKAVEQLQEMYGELSDAEKLQVRSGLHIGRVINEYQEQFGRGDFLIRNVQGLDPEAGAIAIGDHVRVGQTVQFHLRDEASADEDLHELLAAAHAELGDRCLGGLLFTCNGRGTRLFGAPNHDATAVSSHWPALPLAGFFAQGEIGPVGAQSFLHGFTASVVLFARNG